MRIATYNVEWMSNLFDDAGNLQMDDRWSGRRDVTRAQQLQALKRVFREVDADAVMIIEAPDGHKRRDGVAALRNFAAWAGLRTGEALMGFVNETQQEIALLYDPAVLTPHHDPKGPTSATANAPRFDGSFKIDLDVDDTPDTIRWSKPPLELECLTKGGTRFRMIGVHAKSKAPYGVEGADAIMRLAIANRRKQLAQCIWLRRRVDEHLAEGDPLIVLGDFNDGPGLDEYERLFGRSGVEIVLGEDPSTAMFDHHATLAMQRRFGVMPATARFWVAQEERWMQTLIDYIMVSPDLRAKRGTWRIWHPFEDRACYQCLELREALLTASDHFPVSLDIALDG